MGHFWPLDANFNIFSRNFLLVELETEISSIGEGKGLEANLEIEPSCVVIS